MQTKASFGKHPIHPMIIVLPIGLWVFSFICDLVFYGGGSEPWNKAAFYAIGVGILGALVAAIPGFIDLLTMGPIRARELGIWHMILNLVTVALFAANLYLRTTSPEGAIGPFILTIIGLVLLLVSGFLGGEMVYVHGVGVQTQAGRAGEENVRKAA